MVKKQILNLVNFIRGAEPREAMDLMEPVRQQIRLAEKYHLKSTFLIQYDALCDPVFTKMLRGLDSDQFEIGVWLEIVQPLAEKAGLKWTGRYPWDWHAHCGFSVGYTKEQRERLIDILFKDFKSVFGSYPKSMGSWAFDAHTLGYANGQYGLDAACNCKDQWGTDGYTLWGGYYGQGYYPSRYNAFCPAQSKKNQIDTPVFRMLGSDPIYQYDSGLDTASTAWNPVQGVITLEPVYTHEAGGGVPSWVDWYMKENFSGNCLSFGYAQAGQENSFGWPKMKDGLEYQYRKIAEMASREKLKVQTLGDTGRWYKQLFGQTPASSITALSDWKNEGRRSVWYQCKNYRINLYAENGRFWIRDLYLFREDYRERYLDNVCDGDSLTYDNLPLVDGNRFSGNGVRGGLYLLPTADTSVQGMEYRDMTYSEETGKAVVSFTGTPCGDILCTLSEKGIDIRSTDKNFTLVVRYNDKAEGLPSRKLVSDNAMEFSYRGFGYRITAGKGTFMGPNVLRSEDNRITIAFDGSIEP